MSKANTKTMDDDEPIGCDTVTADDLQIVDDVPDLRVYRDGGKEWVQREKLPAWLENSIARKMHEDDQMRTAMAISKSMVESKGGASVVAVASATAAAAAAPKKKPDSAAAAASVDSSSSKLTIKFEPATAALAKPKPKPSTVLTYENTLGQPNEWVSDMALARLYVTILNTKEYPGIYVKCRWPTPANEMVDMFNRGNADTKAALTQPAVLLYTVNIQCGDSKSREFKGNHWVALVIDSRPRAKKVGGGHGLIYYWDPLGSPLRLQDLKEALFKRFEGFVLIDEPYEVQDEWIQCGIWVALYITMFRYTIDKTNNTSLPFHLLDYADEKVKNLTKSRTIANRKVNQIFILKLRKEWADKLPIAPSFNDNSGEKLDRLMHPD